ncbi:MAG: hypothetical protein IK015_05740 [Treponema sp.]|nr:hypothetical protein [Treponema sp.]
MASKFFRLAAFLLFSLTIFAPVDLWAQEAAASTDSGLTSNSEAASIDSGLATDEAPVEESEPVDAVPAEEAVPKSPDYNSSRYEISAIEDAAEGKNYYITRDENNNFSFVQKLSWNKIKDIKNYRITIERMTDAGWVQVMEKDLFENKIEVSLEAGKYRFQVSVINLFDQLEKSSEWQNFEVLKALQPGIDNLQTDSLFLNKKKADGTFTLNGKNLNENTIFTMEKKDCEPPKILYGKVLSLSEDGSSAQVQFDISQVDQGRYEIYAQNPGGLSVISKTLHIKERNIWDFHILASAGYAFPIEVMGGYISKYRKSAIYPVSGATRITFMALHTKMGDLGLFAGANYSLLKAETKHYKFSGHYISALGGLAYQYFFKPKICLDIHGGAGMAWIMDANFTNNYTGQTSYSFNGTGLAFGGGLAIQYNVARHFYVEGGIDFVLAKFKDMNVGMACPSISVGGKF